MIAKVKSKILSKFLTKNNKVIPKARQVYAITTGTYVGEMFVFCKKDAENYHFLSIPKNVNRVIPIDKFDFALDNKIADYVDDLPSKIYQLCYKQFEYNRSKLDSKPTTLK